MGSSYQSGQRYSASQYNYGQTQSGSSSSNNQSGGSAPDDSFKETSKYEILKPYGGRPGFQASHGLKFDPGKKIFTLIKRIDPDDFAGSEDWKEGDAIIEGLQNAADKEKRGGGR